MSEKTAPLSPLAQSGERSDQVQFSGQTKRQRELKKLFPKGTASLQFMQGYLPDCQFLAPLYALSTNPAGQKLLENMIEITPEGNYRVTFPGHPDKPQEFHPDDLRMNFSKHKSGPAYGELGVRVIEWAYARLNKELGGEAYQNIKEKNALTLFWQKAPYHYNNAQVMQDLTGFTPELIVANPKKAKKVKPSFIEKGGSLISASGSFFNENQYSPEYLEEISAKLSKVAKHPERYILTAQTIGKPGDDRTELDKAGHVVGHHVYAIEQVFPERDGLLMVNPHDTRRKVFYLSFHEFYSYFNGLTITKVPV